MKVKSPDSKQRHIDALKQLLTRTDLTPAQRDRIENEIRTTGAGIAAEERTVWEIEFHLGKSQDFMTLHDLRLEIGTRVAQIDHLIITRFFDFWVCDSKAYSEGVEINDDGDWVWYHDGQPRRMESPLTQIDRHISALRDSLEASIIRRPTLLGIHRDPTFNGVVVFSNKTIIKRPKDRTRVPGLERVMNLDRLITTLNAAVAERAAHEGGKTVTAQRIETVAKQLAAAHRPTEPNFLARFGIQDAPTSAGSRRRCSSCGTSVSMKVVAYCRDNAAAFEGRLLCPPCQYRVRQSKAVMHYA